MTTYLKSFISFAIVIIAIVGLSFFSVKIQGHKEEGGGAIALSLNDTMTIAQFGISNNIPNPVLKEVLGLSNKSELKKNILLIGLTTEQIKQKFTKKLTLKASSGKVLSFVLK